MLVYFPQGKLDARHQYMNCNSLYLFADKKQKKRTEVRLLTETMLSGI